MFCPDIVNNIISFINLSEKGNMNSIIEFFYCLKLSSKYLSLSSDNKNFFYSIKDITNENLLKQIFLNTIIHSKNENAKKIFSYLLENVKYGVDEIPFEIACKSNNIEALKKLLWKYKTVNPKKMGIVTACINNNTEVVKILIDDGRVDCSVSENKALIAACDNKNLKIIALLMKDKNVDFSINENYSFITCLEENNLLLAKKIVDEKLRSNNLQHENYIYLICKQKNIEATKKILSCEVKFGHWFDYVKPSYDNPFAIISRYLTAACRLNNFVLIKHIFDNYEHLSFDLGKSYILSAAEYFISEQKNELLQVFLDFKHCVIDNDYYLTFIENALENKNIQAAKMLIKRMKLKNEKVFFQKEFFTVKNKIANLKHYESIFDFSTNSYLSKNYDFFELFVSEELLHPNFFTETFFLDNKDAKIFEILLKYSVVELPKIIHHILFFAFSTNNYSLVELLFKNERVKEYSLDDLEILLKESKCKNKKIIDFVNKNIF